MLDMLWVPLLGVVAGFLSGLLGIGGGIVIVPALIYLLPKFIDVHDSDIPIVAIATSLATIVVTTFSSAKSHLQHGNVDTSLVKPVTSAIAVVSVITPFFVSQLEGSTLTIIFAAIMVLLAFQMVVASNRKECGQGSPSISSLVAGGSITGAIAATAGLGGGAILVPYLSFLKVNIRQAVATAAICGVVVSLFGTLGYFISGFHWSTSYQFIGYVHWPTAAAIMLFSYFSAPIGVRFGQSINQQQLKRIFAVFMIMVAIKLVMEQW